MVDLIQGTVQLRFHDRKVQWFFGASRIQGGGLIDAITADLEKRVDAACAEAGLVLSHGASDSRMQPFQTGAHL